MGFFIFKRKFYDSPYSFSVENDKITLKIQLQCIKSQSLLIKIEIEIGKCSNKNQK